MSESGKHKHYADVPGGRPVCGDRHAAASGPELGVWSHWCRKCKARRPALRDADEFSDPELQRAWDAVAPVLKKLKGWGQS